MANEKTTRVAPVAVTTPKAIAVYPKLTEIDYGTDKYPIKDGAYSVQVKLTASDPAVVTLLAKLDKVMVVSKAAAEAAFAAMPVATRKKLGEIKEQPYFTPVYDENEEETGDIILKFKMKAAGTTTKGKAWSRKPTLIDAKLNKIGANVQIWGGSEVRVSGGAAPYFVDGQGMYGVSLQLDGVQVIQLVTAGGKSAAAMGFEEEEGGFEHDESQFKDESSNIGGEVSGNETAGDVAGHVDF